MSGRLEYMRDLLQAPIVDNRRLCVTRCTLSTSKYWSFFVKDMYRPNSPEMRFSGSFYTNKALPDKASAQAAGRKLCDYLERIPVPLASAVAVTGKLRPMAGLLQVAVFSDLYQGTDWTSTVPTNITPAGFNVIQPQKASGTPRATGEVPVVTDKGNDGTYQAHLISVQHHIHKLDLSVDIPRATFDAAVFWPPIYDKDRLKAGKFPDHDHDLYIRAAEVVRYVQTQMYGAIGTYDEIIKYRDRLLRPFLQEKHRSNSAGLDRSHQMIGPYDNKKLFKYAPVPQHRLFVINPSNYFVDDVQGKLPPIRIITTSRTRIAFVIEKLVAQYYLTNNALYGWKTGLEYADRVSADLISSEEIKLLYCQCSDKDSFTTVHVCQCCLSLDLCSRMSLNTLGYLACCNCINDQAKSDDYKFDPGTKLRSNLRVLVVRDKSINKDDKPEMINRIWDHVQQYQMPFDKFKWQDHWADTTRDERTVSGDIKRQSPFAVSIDAIHPLSVVNDKVVYHANPENICLTAAYLNRLKGLYFPALLGLMRKAKDLRVMSFGQDYDPLLDQFDHFYVQTCRYRFTSKVQRTSLDTNTANKVIHEFSKVVVDQAQANRFFRKMMAPASLGKNAIDWSEEQRLVINDMIAQMEARFDKEIQRAPDGAPWIWIPHHMPTYWSWYRLWRMFAGRLRRMRDLCNRKWQTVDNTVTLFLECVYQHLKLDGRDEFFNLPMTVFKKHALNFSIGHRQHGTQMRTGFTAPLPLDLVDDFDEGLSNICFETRLSNHVKWDHLQSEYDAIHKDMLNVHLKTDYYDVSHNCPRLNFDEIFASATFANRTSDHIANVLEDEGFDVEEEDVFDDSENEWME